MFFEDHVLIVILIIIAILVQFVGMQKTEDLTREVKAITKKIELQRTKLSNHEYVLNSILADK